MGKNIFLNFSSVTPIKLKQSQISYNLKQETENLLNKPDFPNLVSRKNKDREL